jgi:glycosyltransferase involved in cell wall biosynthesis
LKIALVHPYINDFGGAVYVVGRIAQYFDADVYCVKYEKEKTFKIFEDINVNILPVRIPIVRGRLTSGISAGISCYLSKIDGYDIINAHGTPSEWIRNRNSPVVWYCHSPNREAFDLYIWRMRRRKTFQKVAFWLAISAFKIIEYSIVPKIEYIVANSKNTQNRIRKYLNRESEVLYPIFEQKRFEAGSYEKYFFYPSRIAPEKRFEYAIEAFKKFKRERKGWKLIIAGYVSERKEHQEYYNKLLTMCDEDIKILPNVSEDKMKELYENAYCILFTPIDEDFGMVPLEGFMARKPCIAVNEGGPRETIENGKDGFLVNSIDEMAEKMVYLADRPEVVEEMGKKGKEKLKGKFSEKRFFSRLKEIFEDVARDKK